MIWFKHHCESIPTLIDSSCLLVAARSYSVLSRPSCIIVGDALFLCVISALFCLKLKNEFGQCLVAPLVIGDSAGRSFGDGFDLWQSIEG